MTLPVRYLVGAMKCGCRVAVAVDDGADLEGLAQDIRDMKRSGYTMTMETGEQYHANPVKRCVHKSGARLLAGLGLQETGGTK